jgi:two-component system sensor histidine kinase HydH
VDDELRQRLFEPFATTKPHGTGLGLYTSYMLAHAMDGDLWLAPRPGGGTVATLRLRRAHAPGSVPEALPAERRRREVSA